jgi:hypothetical protein
MKLCRYYQHIEIFCKRKVDDHETCFEIPEGYSYNLSRHYCPIWHEIRVYRTGRGKQLNVSKKEERFRDIWVNQSTLGKAFNLSAVAIGKKLKELELRQADGTPTANAISEGYCRAAPLKDGTPFFLWHKRKVKHLLQANGLHSLSEQELRCKELAELLIEAEHLSDQGEDKVAYMMQDSVYDEMEPGDLPVINHFLKALGSAQQLEDE